MPNTPAPATYTAYADIETVTTAAETGTLILNGANLIAISSLRYVLGKVVNVKAYGAVGDGTTDDTTALQGAYDACASGDTLYAPPGTYKFTAALDWTSANAVHLYMPSVTLRPYTTADAPVALTYGGATGSAGVVSQINAIGPSIFTGTAYATSQTALRLQNLTHSELKFGRITSFTTGVQWYGLAAGCQYNRLRVRQFAYCVNALTGGNASGGWTNELHHYGISFAHTNADINAGGNPVKCITVPASANGWSFAHCSFENTDYDETDLYAISCGTGAGGITLLSCRFEKNGAANDFILEVDASPNGALAVINPTGTAIELGVNATGKLVRLYGGDYIIGGSVATPVVATDATVATLITALTNIGIIKNS